MNNAVPKSKIKKDLKSVGWNRFLINHELRHILSNKSDIKPADMKKAWQELDEMEKK